MDKIGLVILIGLLSYAILRMVKDLFGVLMMFLTSLRASSVYDYEKDSKLLYTKIIDMTNRHIHKFVLKGHRKESIKIDNINLVYSEESMEKHIVEITGLVLISLSESYKKRLEFLYLNNLENDTLLMVRDIYMRMINELIDQQYIVNNSKHNNNKNKHLKNKQHTLHELKTLSGELSLQQIYEEFNGIPENRLQTMAETGSSDYTRQGAITMLEIRKALDAKTITINDLKGGKS